jgi:hypothetical protein
MSCRISRLNGLPAFSPRLDFTEATNEEPPTGIGCTASSDFAGTVETGRGSWFPRCRIKKMIPAMPIIIRYN